jgi:hypothetical protein
MADTKQIVDALKTKDWVAATTGVQQVLQQKLGERLAQERKSLGENVVKDSE